MVPIADRSANTARRPRVQNGRDGSANQTQAVIGSGPPAPTCKALVAGTQDLEEYRPLQTAGEGASESEGSGRAIPGGIRGWAQDLGLPEIGAVAQLGRQGNYEQLTDPWFKSGIGRELKPVSLLFYILCLFTKYEPKQTTQRFYL